MVYVHKDKQIIYITFIEAHTRVVRYVLCIVAQPNNALHDFVDGDTLD